MTRRRIITAVLVLAVVAAIGAVRLTAHADPPPPAGLPTTDLQSRLDALVDGEAATAALMRVDDGRRHWSGASGVSDLDSGSPARSDGYFRIGSITKTFVATVVLQLADDGHLRLDDPIDAHLPGVVPNGDEITVRQILNHTSGLYDYMNEDGYSTNRWRGEDRFDSYEPDELLGVAFAHDPYFETPGAKWHYSNTNYIVAGLLIERITGNPYGDEITARILTPLRMRHTVIPGDDSGLPDPHARGYTVVDGAGLTDATEMNPSLDWAAGEMISTTADLNRFFGALLGGRLTSPASLDAMRETVGRDQTGTIFAYGLGLQRFDLPCGTSITGHGGQLLGYMTYSMRADDGRAVTLAYNPYLRAATEAEIVGIMSAAYCPAR